MPLCKDFFVVEEKKLRLAELGACGSKTVNRIQLDILGWKRFVVVTMLFVGAGAYHPIPTNFFTT